MDVTVSIAAKILGIDTEIVHHNSLFTFKHMKPALQGWDPVPASWINQTMIYFNNYKELYFNNFKQSGVVHYVEDQFLTDQIIEQLHVQS